jgi:hypothetical protein
MLKALRAPLGLQFVAADIPLGYVPSVPPGSLWSEIEVRSGRSWPGFVAGKRKPQSEDQGLGVKGPSVLLRQDGIRAEIPFRIEKIASAPQGSVC